MIDNNQKFIKALVQCINISRVVENQGQLLAPGITWYLGLLTDETIINRNALLTEVCFTSFYFFRYQKVVLGCALSCYGGGVFLFVFLTT